jgi:SAM-dependent methyltransferase
MLRCRSCGHFVALHPPHAAADDYHEQYEEGAFVASLAATRARQAAALVRALGRLPFDAEARVLDFGCGRGYFLRALRDAAVPCAGADLSPKAIALVRELGVVARRIASLGAAALAGLRAELPFTPTVVSLLDVIEHFEPDALADTLALLGDTFADSLEYLVVKVPVSNGVLFRSARALARVGLVEPLLQLFQTGTFPPHRHYFSRRSLDRLIWRLRFVPVLAWEDADFEPDRFTDRIQALRGWARPVGALLGHTFDLGGRLLGRDTVILVAAPARHAINAGADDANAAERRSSGIGARTARRE